MSKTYIPAHYHTPLNVYEMQRAIEFIKSNFQVNLSNALNLRRVSAPLFVEENSGLNDNLNGVERPVSFDIPDVGHNAQVVQSLAKWKRLALKRYEFNVGKGLFTDMNAIRRDEEVDNLHSIYVDQWDWEKVIDAGDRNVSYLKRTVRDIVGAIVETNDALGIAFPSLHTKLSRDVFFITTQELEDKYPDLTPKQREDAICREHGTVFLMQIGLTLHSGIKHDGRAPDYDDWTLNGDLLFWNDVLGRAFEISSMGIRVSPESGVVGHGTVSGLPTALASPFIPRLVFIPERVAYRPDMVIERHMGLAGIDSRARQPFDIREHIRLVYELSHFRCPVRALYGCVIFCPEPRIDMVADDPFRVLLELTE